LDTSFQFIYQTNDQNLICEIIISIYDYVAKQIIDAQFKISKMHTEIFN